MSAETIDAYPLQWPIGRKRTDRWQREDARFETTFARARDDVIHQVELLTGTTRWGSADIVISTNVPLRRDGLPLANQRRPDDPGVAVYFKYRGKQRCFPCDRWTKIEDNMRAIAKTIDAMRGIERWGSGDMLDAAFSGFDALPAPDSVKTWRQVLGNATSLEHAHTLYRQAAAVNHPDRGGSHALMAEINAAWQAAQAEFTR